MTENDETPSTEDAASTAQLPLEATPIIEKAPVETPSGSHDRVRQLIREKHAAEALAQRSISEATALREGLNPTARAGDHRAPEDFSRAMAENAVREVGADILARQASQAQERAMRAAQEAWTEATAEFRQKVPDFDAVAHNPNLPVTPVMADAIRESGRGAEIAYYLGKNPEEAAKIAALPPVSQATAIARLESRIGAATNSFTKAPQPVTTLSGRSGSAGKPLEDMDFEEYRKARGF